MDVLTEEGFSRRLRQAMEARDVAPKQLAAATGICYSTVIAYRNGDRLPGVRPLRAMCEALGVSSDWMIGVTTSTSSSTSRG